MDSKIKEIMRRSKKNYRTPRSIRIDDELWNELDKFCTHKNISIPELFENLIRLILEENNNE